MIDKNMLMGIAFLNVQITQVYPDTSFMYHYIAKLLC